MKNNYNQIIKERLDNRKEWLAYYIWLLTHRELHEKAKRAYYKERPILNLIIKFYFLPLNFIRFFSNLFDRYRYDMIKKEIEVLNDEFKKKQFGMLMKRIKFKNNIFTHKKSKLKISNDKKEK